MEVRAQLLSQGKILTQLLNAIEKKVSPMVSSLPIWKIAALVRVRNGVARP